jgi:hypothetical protein
VGSRTAGIADVRTSLMLAGESRLNLVTAELSSPLGRGWAGTGLAPDVEVAELARGEYGDADDGALRQALATVRSLPIRAVGVERPSDAPTTVVPSAVATPVPPPLPVSVPVVVPRSPGRAVEGSGRSRGP